MSSSPRRRPRRRVLSDRTNDLTSTDLILPSRVVKDKRNLDGFESPKKRKRHEDDDEDSNDIQDVRSVDLTVLPAFPRIRRRDICGALRAFRSGDLRARRHIHTSSPSILESFISSNKSDVLRCHSLQSDTFLSPPYACAFSQSSKRGTNSILAIATEEGTVTIHNTARRKDWDPEPVRSSFEVHQNGIFDIKWSPCDAYIATASGDKTVRILDPLCSTRRPSHILRGSDKTVKCIDWDPRHTNLLCSGGRDGQICVWDLRDRQSGQIGDDDEASTKPVLTIPYVHEINPGKPSKRGRTVLAPKSVTSLVYLPESEYQVLSSGAADGIIRKWDLRFTHSSPSKRKKQVPFSPIDETVIDFTTVPSESPSASHSFSPRRARGICSLALGTGPSVGEVFALGNDSRVHTYNALGAFGTPLSIPQTPRTYSHRHMATNSFYVHVAVSPCGRWLASGGANGSAFLFDITDGSGSGFTTGSPGVELKGQEGEVGALDWSADSLATCADDGTVRIWRPDTIKYQECLLQPQEAELDYSWGKA